MLSQKNASRETIREQKSECWPTTEELSEFYDAVDERMISMVRAVNERGLIH